MTKRFLLAGTLLAVIVGGGLALAQSTRVGGRDVPVTPFEQWFKRIGFVNPTAGCDTAVENDSLNTLRITDCTDAANGADLKVRSLWLNAGPGGAASSDRSKVYRLDTLADATATAIFTVTVPNGNHAAVIPIVLLTGLGTGGAVGDWECSGTAYGQLVVERFLAAATVRTAVALSNAGSACSSGATTITTAYGVGTVTNAASATQTFTVTVTVTAGAGTLTNHHVMAQVDLLNANAAGITVS